MVLITDLPAGSWTRFHDPKWSRSCQSANRLNQTDRLSSNAEAVTVSRNRARFVERVEEIELHLNVQLVQFLSWDSIRQNGRSVFVVATQFAFREHVAPPAWCLKRLPGALECFTCDIKLCVSWHTTVTLSWRRSTQSLAASRQTEECRSIVAAEYTRTETDKHDFSRRAVSYKIV